MTELFDSAARHTPVLAILRGFSVARTLELCRAAWTAGVSAVEIPLQGESGRAALRAAVEAGQEAGKLVGAGTITSMERVDAAAEIGAAFTVSPGYDREVAAASRASGLPHLPGVASATDVQHAIADGHIWLKAFPASVLGPQWIRAMLGPFPEARFVATGGIDRSNAAAFLRAGASLVAVGQSIETYDKTWGLAEVRRPEKEFS